MSVFDITCGCGCGKPLGALVWRFQKFSARQFYTYDCAMKWKEERYAAEIETQVLERYRRFVAASFPRTRLRVIRGGQSG